MILLFPNIMPGKNITHAKIIETTGIGDHVNLPDIAILQTKHTIIPVKSAAEKRIETIPFLDSCGRIIPWDAAAEGGCGGGGGGRLI